MGTVTSSRLGEINYNKNGSKMEIIEYINSQNILVQFKEVKKRCQYTQFKTGQVSNPYDKTVYDKGYTGVGKHKVSFNKGKIINPSYDSWHSMLRRCYAKEYQKNNPTYIECTVCDEWLNFQNFAEWYEQNYYGVRNEIMNLDKDILFKGNKNYSPETCVFVPSPINSLFVKNNINRKTTPIGVSVCKNGEYSAQCADGSGKDMRLGTFKTHQEAFAMYKTKKEEIIKQVAEKYRSFIPNKLYYAMLDYTVEITD